MTETDRKFNEPNPLPEYCYVFLPTTHEIGIIQKGETGYYRVDTPAKTVQEAEAYVQEANNILGATKAQAAAMQAGSMFGWGIPAANPKNYDKAGRPVKPKKERKMYKR